MKNLMYGVAYYDEYMPYERIDEDIRLMKKAGINVVRIAESTWSTWEKRPGEFDFSSVIKVMDKMEEAGIDVIIGTPTYAIPAWMVKEHPDVLAETHQGRGIYGCRQIMDITHPVYRFYAERVIRKLMECTAHRSCVIGFQVDNESKYYDTAGPNVQHRFVLYLKEKFHNDLDAMNHEFGLDYWSNRVDDWECFPDVRGTINGSLRAEFDKFRRGLVAEFLSWQADIVNEYKREDQFITHNFDFEWRGHSYGIQPAINHFHAANALTIAGCDIYHPAQDELTGIEIAFGGDVTRSLKQDNYLILETQAQGFPNWTPYPGQLRLQAYAHVASGANMVGYWHWHSIHNSMETYWKGLLSHDFAENATFKEATIIGNEWKRIGHQLVNLKKHNEIAMLVSNEALTALECFKIDATTKDRGSKGYNEVVRFLYDPLYKMNLECDFVTVESENLSDYKILVVPALYAAPEELLLRLKDYVANGGHLVMSFKSAFANENVKVYHEVQPAKLKDVFGVHYHQFTFPSNVSLKGEIVEGCDEAECEASLFMELLIADEANVIASYDHFAWGEYAAITEHTYGKGKAYYVGCMTNEKVIQNLYQKVAVDAEVELPAETFPIVIRKGVSSEGHRLHYYLNFSNEEQKITLKEGGKELISEETFASGADVVMKAWDVFVIDFDVEL